jgi:hypothetical protein
LPELATKATLCLTSLNEVALLRLKRHQLDTCFTAVRCGQGEFRSGPYGSVDYKYPTKLAQIRSILAEELRSVSISEMWFYDDEPANLSPVTKALPTINTRLINPQKGVTRHDFRLLLDLSI